MLFLVTVTVLLASVNARFYTDCDSLATIENVVVSGCPEEASECVLPRNTDVTFNVTFIASTAVSDLVAMVIGSIEGLEATFPLQTPDACENSGLTCPLQPGQQYTQSTVVKTEQYYPALPVEVRWTLQNTEDVALDTDVYEVCIDIKARLQ